MSNYKININRFHALKILFDLSIAVIALVINNLKIHEELHLVAFTYQFTQ